MLLLQSGCSSLYEKDLFTCGAVPLTQTQGLALVPRVTPLLARVWLGPGLCWRISLWDLPALHHAKGAGFLPLQV